MIRAKIARVPITEWNKVDNQSNSQRAIKKALGPTQALMRFLIQNEGLTIVEYAVAAGLITATIAASFGVLGTTIDALITVVIGFL